MRLRRHGDHWLLTGGPVPPGSAAITLGSVVCVRRRYADDSRLLRHEEEHVRQWRQLGKVEFLRQYLGAYLRWRRQGFGHQAAYRLIPLEMEAEAAAERFAADPGDGGGGEGGQPASAWDVEERSPGRRRPGRGPTPSLPG